MSKLSTRKGAAAERELVRELNRLSAELCNVTEPVAVRVLGQARDGGHDVTYRCGLALFEAKHRKVLNLLGAIDQLLLARAEWQQENAGSKALPVVAYKRDRTPWQCLVVLDLGECVQLLEILHTLRGIPNKLNAEAKA